MHVRYMQLRKHVTSVAVGSHPVQEVRGHDIEEADKKTEKSCIWNSVPSMP